MLHIEFFQSRLGDPVLITHGAHDVRACVAEVQALERKDGDRRQPFSVLLEAEAVPALSQGIYTVGFDQGELHDLYLVPAGPRDGLLLYKLVFN